MHDGVCTSLNPAGRETNGSLRSICVYEGDEASKYPLFSFFPFSFAEKPIHPHPLPFFFPSSLYFSLSLSPPATIIRFHRFCLSSVSLIILFRFDFFITEITCEGHGTCCRSFLNRWVNAPNPLFCILENRWCVKLDSLSLSPFPPPSNFIYLSFTNYLILDNFLFVEKCFFF